MAMEPQRLMKLATLASTAVAVTLICTKAVAWVVTDSVSMLTSLVDTSLDLVGSLITLVAVRQALVPPDSEHRFGHGKAEGLAGLVQAGFIAASGCALLVAVAERLNNPRQVQHEEVGLAISAFALGLTVCLVAFQRHVVRRSGSVAIRADMAHYGTDLVATLVTGAGLFVSGLLDLPLVDSGTAGLVAIYLLWGGWTVGRESLAILMDRELPDADRLRIEAIARQCPDVKGVHELRTRSSGLTKFIQLHIDVDRTLSLIRGHEIGRQVQTGIAAAFPDAEIILHIDPEPEA